MRELAGHPELLSLNTATLSHNVPLGEAVAQAAAYGFGAIAPWRNIVDEDNPAAAAQLIRDAGLKVSGYCRTAYLSSPSREEREAAHADNIRALQTATAIEAQCLVAVVGGLVAGSKDAAASRRIIMEGLARLGETAEQLGIPIALEPLHPLYAADRSLLNTTAQALAWCKELDPDNKGTFGICVDAYHIWWDPDLEKSIRDAAGRIMCYQVCDWLVPTKDPLLDRGMPGDGVIDLAALRGMVESAGYDGFVEIEIFSQDDWWKRPPAEVASTSRDRMLDCC